MYHISSYLGSLHLFQHNTLCAPDSRAGQYAKTPSVSISRKAVPYFFQSRQYNIEICKDFFIFFSFNEIFLETKQKSPIFGLRKTERPSDAETRSVSEDFKPESTHDCISNKILDFDIIQTKRQS